MSLTKAGLVQPQVMTTLERDLLRAAGADMGRLVYNSSTSTLQQWDGSAWRDVLVGPTVPSSIIAGTFPMTQVTGTLDGSRVVNAISASQLSGDVDGGVY